MAEVKAVRALLIVDGGSGYQMATNPHIQDRMSLFARFLKMIPDGVDVVYAVLELTGAEDGEELRQHISECVGEQEALITFGYFDKGTGQRDVLLGVMLDRVRMIKDLLPQHIYTGLGLNVGDGAVTSVVSYSKRTIGRLLHSRHPEEELAPPKASTFTPQAPVRMSRGPSPTLQAVHDLKD